MPVRFAKNLPQAHCRQCGKDVEVFVLLDRGDEVVNCTVCGTRLNSPEARSLAASTVASPSKKAPGASDEAFLEELASAMEVEEAITLEPAEADVYYDGALGTVLVADDEQLVRKVISNIFTNLGVARDVVHCTNGSELVKRYGEIATAPDTPIGLLVIDLEMPVLNGLQTAMAVRQFEKSRQLMPVPVLFFSGRKRDPRLEEAMKRLHPAMYMYKGDDGRGGTAEAAMQERVRKVAKLLMREMNA